MPVFNCLSNLPRKFPARLLRRLKEHVYELVHDNDPADRLYVMDIDDDTDVSQIKVVYGVGLTIEKEVRLSSDSHALAVRLTDDPSAPVLPFSLPSLDSEYPSRQAELEALVRAWRSDHLAYIARSRLRAFYSCRVQLELTVEQLTCLMLSAMHHQEALHYWAFRIGRESLIPLIREEVKLDLYPRIRYAARLAFAIGMSEGKQLLKQIAMSSKHRTVRKLAERLEQQSIGSPTIHAEYRSPVRSTHQINGNEVSIDIATVFENPEDVEAVLSHLSIHTDAKSQTRLKQLDAYFYGTRIR